MNLPTELITLVASSVLGGVMRAWTCSSQGRREERLLTLKALNQQLGSIHQARTHNAPGFQWTRRLIALLAVFFIIVFPKIVAVWFPHVPILIGYPQMSGGFLFFSSAMEKITWMTLHGLVITPLDTHLLSAIIGLYFGGSIAQKR